MKAAEEYNIDVPGQMEGTRIDKFLSDYFNDMSRSYLQKLIKENYVFVNDKNVKSNYKLNISDNIKVIIPEPVTLDIKAENIELNIVYEDDDIIIVNKPKNMVVHPAAGHTGGTLVNALLYHCGEKLSGINGVLRPGIVHRIDKDTTGLIVACKNDYAHNFIANQLAEHSITRTYHAITNGKLADNSGVVDKALGRDPFDRKKIAVVPNGKRAVTHYSVINNYRNDKFNENYSYIKCNLETGRTHQIRVHMASLKHPLLGDTVYGPQKCHYKTDGQVLHAKTLGFIHPVTNKYIEFDSELPEYFSNILNNLEIIS